jgi:hypothetical protein
MELYPDQAGFGYRETSGGSEQWPFKARGLLPPNVFTSCLYRALRVSMRSASLNTTAASRLCFRRARWKSSAPLFRQFPTAAVVTGATRLRGYLARRIARGEISISDDVILVGHSTGGLDIRRLLGICITVGSRLWLTGEPRWNRLESSSACVGLCSSPCPVGYQHRRLGACLRYLVRTYPAQPGGGEYFWASRTPRRHNRTAFWGSGSCAVQHPVAGIRIFYGRRNVKT